MKYLLMSCHSIFLQLKFKSFQSLLNLYRDRELIDDNDLGIPETAIKKLKSFCINESQPWKYSGQNHTPTQNAMN